MLIIPILASVVNIVSSLVSSRASPNGPSSGRSMFIINGDGFRGLPTEFSRKRKQSATEGNQARDSAVSLTSAATATSMTQPLPSDQSLMQGMMLDINNRPVPRTLDCYSEFSVPFLPSTIPTADPAAESISPRVLQGIEVSPTEITEIFSL